MDPIAIIIIDDTLDLASSMIVFKVYYNNIYISYSGEIVISLGYSQTANTCIQ